MMQKVLVAGGAGYIGCKLVPVLLEEGYKVRVLDKLYFGKDGLADVLDKIELSVADVRNVDEKILEGIDAVINLAGLSNDPTAEYNPKANMSINVDGTTHLAKLCKKVDVKRYIFASSCSIYYTTSPDNILRNEESAVNPTAPYSYSKHMAEKAVLELEGDGFCPVILRKGTVFGQSPRMRYDLVVNAFTKDAFARHHLVVHSAGRMWRPMLNINDAVKAYIAALKMDEDKVKGQIFNVLNDNYQVIKLAYEVRRTIESEKGARIDLEIQEIGPTRSYRVDNSKFKSIFGVRLNNGIRASVSEMWDKLEAGVEHTAPLYYNIRWLELLDDMEKRLKVMNYKVF